MSKSIFTALAFLTLFCGADLAFADAGGPKGSGGELIAIGAGLAVGLAALGGGLGQGRATTAALEGIARNPQASGKIFMPLIIGLAFIESLVLFAWVIASGLGSKIFNFGG